MKLSSYIKFLAINMKGISRFFHLILWICNVYSLVGVSLHGHSGVFIGRRQYPWLGTPVSIRGNCSFPPGNGSFDVGNWWSKSRHWRNGLYDSFTVLQIPNYLQPSATGICNAVTNILLIHYPVFVADGRCFSLFILLVHSFFDFFTS